LRATRSGAASDCVVSFANTSKLSLGGPGRSSIELEEQELWAAPRRPSASPSRARVAVVLAAGRSERLATVTGGGSTTLIRLAGVSLVERAIRAVLGAGVEEVLVVVGYHAGPVAAVVRAIRGLTPGRIRIVLAEDWESGNGASLSAAAHWLEAEELFVVMTVDHVFGEGALDRLCRSEQPSVLVDPDPSSGVWSEGTRVRLADWKAVALGKHLDDPAVDCGVFALSREIFDCRSEAAREGDGSLAGAVTRFAERRSLRAIPLARGTWWQDVDTPHDLKKCKTLLRRSLRKATDGPVSRYLNRPVSTRLSWWLASARLSPDLLSWLALLVGLVAGPFLSLGWGIAGGVLAQVTSVLDGMDGEAARLQMRASAGGALFDGILDRVADVAIVAGTGVWALDAVPSVPALVLVLAVAASFGSVISMASKDRISAHALPHANERALAWLLGGRDGRLFIVAVCGILGLPMVALVAITATSISTLGLRLIAVRRITT